MKKKPRRKVTACRGKVGDSANSLIVSECSVPVRGFQQFVRLFEQRWRQRWIVIGPSLVAKKIKNYKHANKALCGSVSVCVRAPVGVCLFENAAAAADQEA